MQRLEFNIPNNLDILHDELIATIPAFHRVVLGDSGFNESCEDCGAVKGVEGWCRITFADDIDPDLVTAVVLAHDARKVRPPTRKEELLAIPEEDWTIRDVQELIGILTGRG